MIDYKTALSLFTDYLNREENFTFTKLGDGEIFCLRGDSGGNCDGHPYTPELSDKLYMFVKSISEQKNFYVAKWEANDSASQFRDSLLDTLNIKPVWVEYNSVLPQTYNLDNPALYDFYAAIKNSKKRKIYICPDRLNAVKSFLNIDIIQNIPVKNSFSVYDILLEQMRDYVKDDDIVLYSCGLMSKSFITELSVNKNITNIDIGSGLDSLFVGNTRLGQPSVHDANKYFKNLLF